MTKKEAFEIVFDELTKANMFRGKASEYANVYFMNGIGTVMEVIANNISEEKGRNFGEEFTKNLIQSRRHKHNKNKKEGNKHD